VTLPFKATLSPISHACSAPPPPPIENQYGGAAIQFRAQRVETVRCQAEMTRGVHEDHLCPPGPLVLNGLGVVERRVIGDCGIGDNPARKWDFGR